MDLTIDRIDRIPISVPFREVPERHMRRELPHWTYFDVFEVELASGDVGHGETMCFYSWGETTEADVQRAEGVNAATIMWDDSIGPGLQIACFDAVGRALDVPVYDLLGGKSTDRTPISWWCIDMPPEDWVAEAERALEAGYTNLKVKTRPWFDIRAQLDALDTALPEWFGVDVDFNDTLLDADRALPLLSELEEYPQLSHIEGPIPYDDQEGTHRLTTELDTPIVLHYEDVDTLAALSKPMCDGFVTTAGADHLRDVDAVTRMADHPFWLQLVGTDITAAFSLHCGAAFEKAEWPAINCHQLYETGLLREPIEVEDGHVTVPDEPGLGYSVDMETVRSYEVDRPDERPNPPRLIESDWPDGPTIYLAEGEVNFMIQAAMDGTMPYFEAGVQTRTVPDDGSEQWESLHERARDEPVVLEEPAL